MDERSETIEPNGWANEFWILYNEMMKVHNILYPAALSGLATPILLMYILIVPLIYLWIIGNVDFGI